MGAADGAVYTRNRVSAGGFEIPYLRGGRGRPLLYLHGLGGAGRWDSYHMAFANDTCTYAPQLPGFQDFELPDGITSVAAYAQLVVRFLDAVDLDRTVLIGHSIGGWLALRIAMNHPERVERLVVIDPLGLATPAAPALDLSALDAEEFAKRALAKLGLIATAQPFGFGAEFSSIRTSPEFERQWKGRGLVGRLVHGPCADAELIAGLGSISAPTSVIWGERDGIAPPEHGHLLRDSIPNARMVLVEGAAHLPMVERRETFHRICHDVIVGIDEQIPGAVEA